METSDRPLGAAGLAAALDVAGGGSRGPVASR